MLHPSPVSMRKSSDLKNMYDSPRFDSGKRSTKRRVKDTDHEVIRRARKQAEYWRDHALEPVDVDDDQLDLSDICEDFESSDGFSRGL